MRRVGNENAERICAAIVSDPVENLGGTIGLNIVTGSHHDEANCQEADHDDKTLWAAPDIENFSEWKLAETANDL